MSIPPNTCSVKGCNSQGKKKRDGSRCLVRGYCGTHYEKFRLHGDPLYGRNHVLGEGRLADPLYHLYRGIKKRCLDANDHNYLKYGARGVTMYDDWIDNVKGFTKFSEYIREELGEKLSPEHSIDRIDNTKGYEPGNLRWATATVQAINRRTPANNTSGQKGVYFSSSENRWCATISINGKKKKLGRFKLKSEAIKARFEAEKLYYAPLLEKD